MFQQLFSQISECVIRQLCDGHEIAGFDHHDVETGILSIPDIEPIRLSVIGLDEDFPVFIPEHISVIGSVITINLMKKYRYNSTKFILFENKILELSSLWSRTLNKYSRNDEYYHSEKSDKPYLHYFAEGIFDTYMTINENPSLEFHSNEDGSFSLKSNYNFKIA